MILESFPAINQLTAAEKLLLLSEIWDDLASRPSEIPVTREQIAELEKRREEYLQDPTEVTTWEAVQKRLLGRTLGGE